MKRQPVTVIAATAVIAVAAGIAIGLWLVHRPESPTVVAERFVDALAAGDADAVRGLLADPDGVDDTVWAAFTSADAYLEPGATTQTESTGASAEVTVDVALTGSHHDLALSLAADGASWKVVSAPLGEISVAATRTGWITVGDATVSLPSADGSARAEIGLLPAVYTVAPWPSTYLDGAQQVVSDGSEAQRVDLEPVFTAAVSTEADEALRTYLEECTRHADTVPPACGLVIPWPADLATMSSVDFRVDAMPSPAIDLDSATFSATGGSVVATVHGALADGRTADRSYRLDGWSLTGSIEVDADGIALNVF